MAHDVQGAQPQPGATSVYAGAAQGAACDLGHGSFGGGVGWRWPECKSWTVAGATPAAAAIAPVTAPFMLEAAYLGRMLLVGNASGDWQHPVATNSLWLGSLAIAGFSSGYYFPAHPE